MKKLLLTFFIVIFGTALCFAEINAPNRFFEFGTDGDSGVSNNSLGLSDILVKDLVIDLDQIIVNMPEDGLNLNLMAGFDTYAALNLKNLRIKGNVGLDASGNLNISKNLFEFLADGNGSTGEADETFSGSMYGDVFLVEDVTASFKIGKIRYSFIPAVFQPIVHVEAVDPAISYTTTADGHIEVSASSGVAFYSYYSMEDLQSISSISYSDAASKVFGGSGFDFTAKAQYPWNKHIDLGIYTRIPVIPGRLAEKSSATATVSYETDSILNSVLNSDLGSPDTDISDWTSETGVNFQISRPLRFGVEAEMRPFEKTFFLTVYGLGGIGVKYPFTSSAVFYPEYDLRVSTSLFNILGASFSTEYLQQVFIHELSLMINVRIFELDAAISLQGANFVNSFKMDGFGAKFCIKTGF